jgi:hypothetical protein
VLERWKASNSNKIPLLQSSREFNFQEWQQHHSLGIHGLQQQNLIAFFHQTVV